MRLLVRIVSTLALGCVLVLGACSPVTPTQNYECTCRVMCGSVESRWNAAVCETEGSEDVAAEDAQSLCVRDQNTCASPSCSCGCSAHGGC
jgi:hypothetical protein